MKDTSRRTYTSDRTYPDAMRQRPAKDKWNATLEANPELSEFKKTLPTQAEVNIYRPGLVQSEFKKPYEDNSYEEMEYASDPWIPPDQPPFDFPPDEPIVPEPVAAGGKIVFYADLIGSVCAGKTTEIEVYSTQKIKRVALDMETAGWSITKSGPSKNPWGKIKVKLPIDAMGILRVDVFMSGKVGGRSISGQSDASTDIVDNDAALCPRVYVEFKVENGGTSESILFDPKTGTVPTDIPDGLGGFLSFPCHSSQLSAFYGLVTRINALSQMNEADSRGTIINCCTVYPEDCGIDIDRCPTAPFGSTGIATESLNGPCATFEGLQYQDGAWNSVCTVEPCSYTNEFANMNKTIIINQYSGILRNIRNEVGAIIAWTDYVTLIKETDRYYGINLYDSPPKRCVPYMPTRIYPPVFDRKFRQKSPGGGFIEVKNLEAVLYPGTCPGLDHISYGAYTSTWNKKLDLPGYPDISVCLDVRVARDQYNQGPVYIGSVFRTKYNNSGYLSKTVTMTDPTNGTRNTDMELHIRNMVERVANGTFPDVYAKTYLDFWYGTMHPEDL